MLPAIQRRSAVARIIERPEETLPLVAVPPTELRLCMQLSAADISILPAAPSVQPSAAAVVIRQAEITPQSVAAITTRQTAQMQPFPAVRAILQVMAPV